MDGALRVQLPYEMGEVGQFIDLMRQFFTAYYTREMSELTIGRAYDTGNGKMVFRSRNLQQFMTSNGSTVARNRFFNIMHNLGVVEEHYQIGEQQIRVWTMQKFDDFIDPDLEVKNVDTEY